jgi:hypothetical protein
MVLLKRKFPVLTVRKKQKFFVIFQNICKYFHSNEKNNDIAKVFTGKEMFTKLMILKRRHFYSFFLSDFVDICEIRSSVSTLCGHLWVLGRLNINNPLPYVPEKRESFFSTV